MRREALVLFLALPACGNDSTGAGGGDAGVSLGDGGGGFVDADIPDGAKAFVDGGFAGPDGGVIRADRFVTNVVSFTPGECAGFGIPDMPNIVEGPPVGAGSSAGSLDVVSLGIGGEIVLSFEPNAIVDGPGADFIVFENAFWTGGDPSKPAADYAEVSVSEDGTTWKTYACAPPSDTTACAGWHPVYSAPGNGISPVDPATAGGEAYDLASVGLTKAKLVRIKDRATSTCDGTPPKPTNYGFDLDAISIVNAETP